MVAVTTVVDMMVVVTMVAVVVIVVVEAVISHDDVADGVRSYRGSLSWTSFGSS
jgi:competence protein ComGC